MSFRKRSEILSTPSVPGRVPVASQPGTLPGRQVPIGIPSRTISRVAGVHKSGANGEEEINKNPAVRPSLITSQPTISTGVADLDKILQHLGIPLGQSLLVEESGSTDFASIILRAFASQGVIHNRLNKDELNCHCIVIGVTGQWCKELPGIYKGSTKEQKKAKIKEIENKVSVSNLNDDMKIAWRYGLNKKTDTNDGSINNYEGYNHQFDITQKLLPSPNNQDMSFISLNDDYKTIIKLIDSIIQQQLKLKSGKIIRLILPNLLNPSIYHPKYSLPTFIFPFIHSLRSILRKYSSNVVLIASLPLDLYPRDGNVTGVLESSFDAVIYLQPFNQEMSQLIEKAYKNEPSKIQHGLVNIIKLPILSERGLMMIHDGEFAFKNGRKKFEIEDWGIPVDDDSKDDNNINTNSNNNNNQKQSQTTKNIDF